MLEYRAAITNWGKVYYKLRQVLYIRAITANLGITFFCSFGYKLVYVDDKFSKPLKFYLGEDAVYNFINSMNEESKL